jgi:hypothetical protein
MLLDYTMNSVAPRKLCTPGENQNVILGHKLLLKDEAPHPGESTVVTSAMWQNAWLG